MDEFVKLAIVGLFSGTSGGSLIAFVLWWLRRKSEVSFNKADAAIATGKLGSENTRDLIGVLNSVGVSVDTKVGKIVSNTDTMSEDIKTMSVATPKAIDDLADKILVAMETDQQEIRDLLKGYDNRSLLVEIRIDEQGKIVARLDRELREIKLNKSTPKDVTLLESKTIKE